MQVINKRRNDIGRWSWEWFPVKVVSCYIYERLLEELWISYHSTYFFFLNSHYLCVETNLIMHWHAHCASYVSRWGLFSHSHSAVKRHLACGPVMAWVLITPGLVSWLVPQGVEIGDFILVSVGLPDIYITRACSNSRFAQCLSGTLCLHSLHGLLVCAKLTFALTTTNNGPATKDKV